MSNSTAPPEPTPPPLFLLSGLLDALEADATARYQAKQENRPLGPVTRFKKLDQLLGDALGVGLHMLHGGPGVGKTAFGMQTGATCGSPCLYITAEMHPLELLRRHTARATETFLGRLKSGEIPPEEIIRKAKIAAAAAPLLAILDATEVPAPMDCIQRAAEALKKKSDYGHVLVVVDSLHSWADGLGDGMEEYDRLNYGLAALRQLAKRLTCPVLAIVERNRAAMRSSGQNSGAGTRKIEYGAESVIALDADDDAKPDANGEIDVKVKVSKNRNGANGSLTLKFHGALQRYEEAPI